MARLASLAQGMAGGMSAGLAINDMRERNEERDRIREARENGAPGLGPAIEGQNDALDRFGGPTNMAAHAAQGDRDLLAKTLMAEAGGEGEQGLLAAGAVIANRARSGGYGDGISGVIMKPGQFSAWNGVTGYAGGEGALDMDRIRPSETAYRVADRILSGDYKDPTGGATHYYNPSVATPAWGRERGGDWLTIGNHIFGRADAGRSGGSRTPTRKSQAAPAAPPARETAPEAPAPGPRREAAEQPALGPRRNRSGPLGRPEIGLGGVLGPDQWQYYRKG